MAQTRETPSPLCNRLLEQAAALAAGSLTTQALEQDVAEQLRRLEQARHQTLERIQERGGAHLERFREAVVALEQSFDDMEQALHSLARLARSEERLETVQELLVKAGFSGRAASDLYKRAELEAGPSEIPMLNLLERAREGLSQGSVTPENFRQTVAGAVTMTRGAREELRRAAPGQPPELAALARAYDHQLEALSRFEADPRSWEELVASSHGVRDAMAALNLALMRSGPTRLERANVFLNVAQAHHDEQVPAPVLAQAIDGFYEDLEAEWKEFEQLASVPNPPAALEPEIDRARDAYERQSAALELFAEYLEGDEPLFQEAWTLMVAASDDLARAREAFLQVAEEGRPACVRCGAANEPAARVCSACGAQMPQIPGSEGPGSTLSLQEALGQAQGEELELTENLLKLFQAINGVSEGSVSPEAFEEVLIWMDQLLEEGQASMPAVPAQAGDETLEAEMGRQRHLMLEGMDQFRDALSELQQYLVDGDAGHLTAGTLAVRDSALKLQRAESRLQELAKG